jgi:hypothetical protein
LPPIDPERYYSLRWSAWRLSIDEKTLRKYLTCDLLEYAWFKSRRRIKGEELIDFLRRNQAGRKAG